MVVYVVLERGKGVDLVGGDVEGKKYQSIDDDGGGGGENKGQNACDVEEDVVGEKKDGYR